MAFDDIYFVDVSNGVSPLYTLQIFMKDPMAKEKRIHLIAEKTDGRG